MKIDTDLRLAIKAAEKAQKQNSRSTWNDRQEQERKNIARFVRDNAAKGRLAGSLAKRYKDVSETLNAIHTDLGAMGLAVNSNGLYLNDRERFIKAGGTGPIEEAKPWVAEYVMAEIAKATPKEAAKILIRIGINWQ